MRWFVSAIGAALRGYRRGDFFADLGAGVTVGLVALPLAIGFGIASGITPQQGLWTGIIASGDALPAHLRHVRLWQERHLLRPDVVKTRWPPRRDGQQVHPRSVP